MASAVRWIKTDEADAGRGTRPTAQVALSKYVDLPIYMDQAEAGHREVS